MNIGDLFVTLRADVKGLRAQVERDLGGVAGGVGAQAGQTFGQRFGDQVNRGTVIAGAAVGTFLAGSIQAFSRFDDQMRSVYSILPGISASAMSKMEGDVKSLAVEMGRLPEDIIPGLYDALSSGIPQDNVFAFMEAASKGAVAGGANTREVVRTLAATINAFGLDAANTEQLTDSFFNAINRGVTTFPELAQSMAGVAPQAAALGVSIDEVLAAVTALTLQGTPTAEAVTQINASLTALQRTTPTMETALRNLGFATGDAALKTLGYQGTMDALAGQAKQLGVPLIDLTGRLEGASAMMQLTGEKSAAANELLGTFQNTTGLTTQAFEKMEGGVGGAARRLGAQVAVMAIDIGERFQALGPVFTAFGPTMGRLLGAGIGAAGGLAVNGIRMLFAGLLPAMLGQATAAGTAAGVAQGNAQAAAAASPGIGTRIVMAVVGMLKGLALAVVGPGTLVGTAIGKAIAAGQAGAGFLQTLLAPILRALVGAAIAVAGPSTLIGTAISTAISIGMAAFPFILGALIVGFLIKLASDPEFRQKALDIGMGVIKFIVDGVVGIASFVGDALVGVFKGAFDLVANFVGTAISGIIQPIVSVVELLNEATGGAMQGIVDDLHAFQGELESWGTHVSATANVTADGFRDMDHRGSAALQSLSGSSQVAAVGVEGAMGDITTATGGMAAEVGVDADIAAQALRDSMLQTMRDAAWAGKATPREYAAGLRSEFASPRDAMTALKDLMKETLNPVQKEAELIGIASSKRLAKGLNDQRPEVKAEAQQIALDTIRELAKLNPKSEEIGRLSMKLLAGATVNQKPAIKDAIDTIVAAAERNLANLGDVTKTAGQRAAEQLAIGIASRARAVSIATSNLAHIVQRGLQINSPAKEGPWSKQGGPIAWLSDAADSMWGGFIDHTRAARPAVEAAVAATAASVASWSGTAMQGLSPTLGVSLPEFAMPALATTSESVGTMRYQHEVNLSVTPESAEALRAAGYESHDIAAELRGMIDTAYANRSLRWSNG